MRSPRKFPPGLFLLGLAVCAGAAGAQTAPRPEPSSRAGDAVSIAGLGRSVDAGKLATLAGGTDTSEQMTLTGNVADNNTTDVSTGYNSIGGDSFSGAVGVPMVIQNSGNSVLIQNATIIDIQFQQ